MVQKEQLQNVALRLENLETEVFAIKKIIGSEIEKKDPQAWNKLEKLGEKIAKAKKIEVPSWKIISESRR